jgi:hypothetical protein
MTSVSPQLPLTTLSQPLIPLTTQPSYSIGPVLIGLIVIAVLVGIALYMYTRDHQTPPPVESQGQNSFSIVNSTQLKYIITLPEDRKIELNPGQIEKVFLAEGDTIKAKAYTYDGLPLLHEYRVPRFPRSKDSKEEDTESENLREKDKESKIYLTPSGFSSNASGSENVIFVNRGPYPILFIEKSDSGGRRWASDIVPPLSQKGGHFVSRGSTWEVAHPSNEDSPIDSITIGGKVQALLFDGKLRSE